MNGPDDWRLENGGLEQFERWQLALVDKLEELLEAIEGIPPELQAKAGLDQPTAELVGEVLDEIHTFSPIPDRPP